MRCAWLISAASRTFVEAGDQIYAAIDDAPGQIAAEGANEHGPDLDLVSGRNTERTGKGESHDQAEQYLRNSVHRIEDTIRQFDWHPRINHRW
jgi:hypothetical protein